jgi:Uma2 family endonuclease
VATETVLTATSPAEAEVETTTSALGFPVRIRPLGLFSDDQFYEFCRLNSDIDIERTAHGDLLIMAPASFRTSHINLRIVLQLGRWAERDGTGVATESSGGFVLPNSAVRAPDAAWIRRDRLTTVAREQQDRFLPLCPDFAIELRSPSDTLDTAQAKMREYLENGLRLGWLIDPFARRVYVYRPGADVDVLEDPAGVDGGPVLPGFRLDLSRIW